MTGWLGLTFLHWFSEGRGRSGVSSTIGSCSTIVGSVIVVCLTGVGSSDSLVSLRLLTLNWTSFPLPWGILITAALDRFIALPLAIAAPWLELDASEASPSSSDSEDSLTGGTDDPALILSLPLLRVV